MKKIIIADTLTEFREIDINDLYVEVVSGIIYSNQYAFEESSFSWLHLSNHKLPPVILNALQESPTQFEAPQTLPEGFEDRTEEFVVVDAVKESDVPVVEFDTSALMLQITEVVRSELNSFKTDVTSRVEKIETRISGLSEDFTKIKTEDNSIILAKINNILNETIVLEDINRKVTKVLNVSKDQEELDSNNTEISKKFNALKVKYKNLSVENKVAKKNLSKVIAKAKALNAKLEVAEKELETFKNIANTSIESKNTGNKFNMISRDDLKLDDTMTSTNLSDTAGSSEDVTGEFQLTKKGNEETTRAQAEVDELESLDLDGLKSGKSFEISNEQTWMYDTGTGVVGPLRFDEIKSDFKKLDISKDTLIKRKPGTPWVPASECLELNTESKLLSHNDGNPENDIYLIERTEYRIELHEVISFSIKDIDKDFKGYLSNLSLSGGFIEVTKYEKDFAKQLTGTMYINEGDFSKAIAVDFTIMRTSKTRPKGLGIRFDAVSDSVLEVIGERMIQSLNQDQDQKKAA